jgi:hypothetical protein
MKLKENPVTQHKLAVLKDDIEKRLGRKIKSSGDCNELSIEIFTKTSQPLNPNTLRRFFGLVPYKFMPSTATLHILSRYCGYTSFDQVPEVKKISLNNTFQKESILEFLTSLYRIDTYEKNDLIYCSIVKETVKLLNRNDYLINDFHRDIAKLKNGRTYYFEKFIHIDGLNSIYGEGLREYLSEKRSIEDDIMGHSLLMIKYWSTMDDVNLERHYDILSSYKLKPGISGVHAARYFSAILLYHSSKNNITEHILEEAGAFYSTLQREVNYDLKSSFEFIFSMALALSGHLKESLVYLKYAKKNFLDYGHNNDADHQSLNLYEAFVLCRLNKQERAKSLFIKVDPEAFCILSKKVESIIYYIIKSKLEHTPTKYFSKAEHLIEETGYKRLRTLLYDDQKVSNNVQRKCYTDF